MIRKILFAAALAACSLGSTAGTEAPKKPAPAKASPAMPADASMVLRVPIGSLVNSYPECSDPAAADRICREDFDSRNPNKSGNLSHVFMLRPDKLGFAASNLMVSTADGKVSSIYVKTRGFEVQTQAYEYLTRALGKPSSLERPIFRTLAGASVEAIDALWMTPTGSVTFKSLDGGRIDAGALFIQAP